MSGEYYCIEEVDPTAYYRGDYDQKSSKSKNPPRKSYPESVDQDARSSSSKRSQDVRLYEIEEQLQVAENRCNTLKGQLASMKKVYEKSTNIDNRGGRTTNIRTEASLIRKNEGNDNALSNKFSRKRANSPSPRYQRSRQSSPTVKRCFPNRTVHESTDSINQHSSSSSTALIRTTAVPVMRPREHPPIHQIRQQSATIGTDTSGAAVRTINSILSGITESVNRLSKIHLNDNKSRNQTKVDSFTGIDVGRTIFTVPIKSFVRKNEKNVFCKTSDEKSSADDWDSRKYSISSLSKKTPSRTKWSRRTSTKATTKTKIQCSSGSINLAKSTKSTAKQSQTGKLRNGTSGLLEAEAQSGTLSRRGKRTVKRSKGSKISLGRKFSDHSTQKHYDEYASDNLVELYHNVAAKGSDSGESNSASKPQINRQKGGGDLFRTSTDVATKKVATKKADTSSKMIVARDYQSQRMLTPINENTMDDNDTRSECLNILSKRYAGPTIASKLKQATKAYFHTFNFRSIPFCAAKSITPSHNIGINIQQVMSIMKTRQPITGISATLAHNISLAAEKLQSRPLSVLVSTLSSKMGYGIGSQCPLMRNSINREQLQEMAKDIPEELEQGNEAEDHECGQTGNVTKTEGFSRGASGDREEREGTMWSLDTKVQRRCSCVSQKGFVPFQHVLNKYQLATDHPSQIVARPQTTKSHISRRITKTPIDPMLKKEATKNWVKNEASQSIQSMKTDANSLNGRERNLKTVLVNLHDEFDALNTKYENLAKTVNKNNPESSKMTMKKLESMEELLNKKEEEINMVMALYTEVGALKDQVKKLKNRTSTPSVALTQKVSTENKNSNAALHLTQLLRQIQQYQLRYKNKV